LRTLVPEDEGVVDVEKKEKTLPPPKSLLENHPWIQEVLSQTTGHPCEGAPSSHVHTWPDIGADPSEPLDLLIDAAWHRIVSAFDDSELTTLGEADDFVCKMRVDGHERAHGVFQQHAAVYPRGGEAKRWCRKYGMGEMHSFSTRLYTNHGAWALALETARRLQCFYEIFKSVGDDNYQYSDTDIHSCEPCAEFTSVWLSLSEDNAAFAERAKAVEMIAPPV
jgi:hypothetical protein